MNARRPVPQKNGLLGEERLFDNGKKEFLRFMKWFRVELHTPFEGMRLNRERWERRI